MQKLHEACACHLSDIIQSLYTLFKDPGGDGQVPFWWKITLKLRNRRRNGKEKKRNLGKPLYADDSNPWANIATLVDGIIVQASEQGVQKRVNHVAWQIFERVSWVSPFRIHNDPRDVRQGETRVMMDGRASRELRRTSILALDYLRLSDICPDRQARDLHTDSFRLSSK